jgi:hypothetical protein
MIAALLREREVYTEQDNREALATVNKRLAALGHKDKAEPRSRRAPEDAKSTTTARKSAAKKSTGRRK